MLFVAVPSPRLAGVEIESVPAPIVLLPVNVLEPETVNLPDPTLSNPPAPPPSTPP